VGTVSQRNVQLVVLCEDTQQESFVRRFLKKTGWSTRRLRVEKSPGGSAEQFVRERFPIELEAYRKKRGQVGQAVVVMIDGDNRGVKARLLELETACQAKNIQSRQPEDNVAIFIPTWNIETWFAYLVGQEVDEDKSDYPKLKHERDCSRHVNSLTDMCNLGQLRIPAPPSLQTACTEYKERLTRSG